MALVNGNAHLQRDNQAGLATFARNKPMIQGRTMAVAHSHQTSTHGTILNAPIELYTNVFLMFEQAFVLPIWRAQA